MSIFVNLLRILQQMESKLPKGSYIRLGVRDNSLVFIAYLEKDRKYRMAVPMEVLGFYSDYDEYITELFVNKCIKGLKEAENAN